MKRLYLIVFISAAVLAGCARADVDTPRPGPCAGDVSFMGIASQEETRVSHKDAVTSLKPSWVRDDRVGIFAGSGQVSIAENIQYKASEGGSRADFKAVLKSQTITWADDTSEHDFYAYYPYSENAGTDPAAIAVSVPAVQQQVGVNLDHLGDLDFMYASVEGATPDEGVVEFSFDHLFSILEVKLTADRRSALDAVIFRCKDNTEKVSLSGAKVNLATGVLDMSEAAGTNEIRLDCSYVTFPSTGSLSTYMLITPGHAGKEFEVLAVIKGEERLLTTKKVPAGGIPAGRTAVITSSVAVDPEDELPVVNLSTFGMANTYYVSEAYTLYRFNAMYKGNGLERNYRFGSNRSLSYSKTDLRIYPKSALVLWYNCVQKRNTTGKWIDESPIVVQSVMLGDDGFIYFDTPGTFVNGNVVIVAFAEKGVTYDNIEVTNGVISNATILWSWNIVASEGYDPNAGGITAGEYTIMDRDLGAVISRNDIPSDDTKEFAAVGAVGNYYQWGRKDPFPPFPDYASFNSSTSGLRVTPTYTPIVNLRKNNLGTGTYAVDGQIFGIDDDGFTIEADTGNGLNASVTQSVRNPYKWLKTTSNSYYWAASTADSWRALWGNPIMTNCVRDESDKIYTPDPDADTATNVKSIYDPCPLGWKLWNNAAFAAFVEGQSATVADTGLGLDVRGSYFAFNGGRGYSGGLDGNVGGQYAQKPVLKFYSSGTNAYSGVWNTCFKWSVDANFTVGQTISDFTGRLVESPGGTKGYSVRCMRDTEEGVIPDPDKPQFQGNSDPQIGDMGNWNGWE